MKLSNALLGLILVIVIALPVMGIAEESKLPEEGAVHVDVKALTLINLEVMALERNDEPEDAEATVTGDSSWGSSGAGLKVGYLINGHHDVGGHVMVAYSSTVMVLDPEDDDLDETKTRMNTADVRLAAYYNYNWHALGWIMPYVGPMVGADIQYNSFEDLDEDDSLTSTAVVTPFMGVEGGVKLFPHEYVAFDIGIISTYGPTTRVTYFEDDDLDEIDWSGGTFNVGLNAGVNVYF